MSSSSDWVADDYWPTTTTTTKTSNGGESILLNDNNNSMNLNNYSSFSDGSNNNKFTQLFHSLFLQCSTQYFEPACVSVLDSVVGFWSSSSNHNMNNNLDENNNNNQIWCSLISQFSYEYIFKLIIVPIFYPLQGMPVWLKSSILMLFFGIEIDENHYSNNENNIHTLVDNVDGGIGSSSSLLQTFLEIVILQPTKEQQTCFAVFCVCLVLLIGLGILHLRFKKYVNELC